MKKLMSCIIIIGLMVSVSLVGCNGQSVGQDVYDAKEAFLDGQYPGEGYKSYDEVEEHPIMQEDL